MGATLVSHILLRLHRYPFPEAASTLIALDKRCAHQGDVLGDRAILALMDCDAPEGRAYVRTQLARQDRRVQVGMTMLRSRSDWAHAEGEAALRAVGERTLSPDGKRASFRGGPVKK